MVSDWEYDIPDRPPSGKLYQCSACGKENIWGPTWSWYGSLADLEYGRPTLKFCSDTCAGDKAEIETTVSKLKKINAVKEQVSNAEQELSVAEQELTAAQAKVTRLKHKLGKGGNAN